MASHESNEDSAKSAITDKGNTTVQSKDEKKLSTISSPVGRHDELSDIAADTKEKNLTSDTTNDYTNMEKNDSNNVKKENKDDLKSLITDKQDDDKTTKKQETQNIASLADPQNRDEEKEVKSKDNKDSLTKGGSVLKRKRKTLRLIQ